MYLKTKQEIQELLRHVAADRITLKEFGEKFSYLYIYREDYPILDPQDENFFDKVLEKLGWTADNPTPEERAWGWIDFNEFKKWLRGVLEEYLKTEQIVGMD